MAIEDELKLEHFKALKEEHRQYLLQVQQLWFYKLSTLGAIITVAVFNGKIKAINDVDAETVVALGISSLPLLSFLIDLKVLEIGLHVKSISDYLQKNFTKPIEIKAWEKDLWSGTDFSKVRTLLTIISALGTSFLVLILAFIFVYNIKPDWLIYLVGFSIISSLIVVLTGIKFIPKLLDQQSSSSLTKKLSSKNTEKSQKNNEAGINRKTVTNDEINKDEN